MGAALRLPPTAALAQQRRASAEPPPSARVWLAAHARFTTAGADSALSPLPVCARRPTPAPLHQSRTHAATPRRDWPPRVRASCRASPLFRRYSPPPCARRTRPPPQRRSSSHGWSGHSAPRPAVRLLSRAAPSVGKRAHAQATCDIRPSVPSSLSPLRSCFYHCRARCAYHPCLRPLLVPSAASCSSQRTLFFSSLLRSPPTVGLASSLRRLRSIT